MNRYTNSNDRPAEYITASQLVLRKPNTDCCDCGKEAAEAREDSVWTIWHKVNVYCPMCANNEGIGPDD